MSLTPYHAKYYAYELTRRCPPDSDDRLASALVDAQVDLNPHQIDAALFSFRSPLSCGVLLADEVGLGKTIEAGLVLAQRWAERKRRILVITPSNLRKQWHQELSDKFFLPCRILEAKSYNDAIKAGQFRPFEADGHIVICSYQFARNKAADVHTTAWDLVVMDEAHRLRNVYKPSNVIANTLKQALASAPKLLLTATPLQNSLLELFGLVSMIDDQVFGDLKSFREQFSDLTQEQVFATLKRRLAPLCHRTLRRQVTAYVSYTRRLPLVEQFTPDESEDRLYDLVSEYLRRDNLKALPSGQRTLMTLVMRKLLASSSFAIAGALDTLVNRLKATLAKQTPSEPLIDELDEDYEALDETAEEWEDEDPGPPLSTEDRESLAREIADLEQFRDLATSITHNAKGAALLKALQVAFVKAAELGGAKKAIIFTESRKTQLYLQRLLADGPWKDGLVLFNGSNTDERSRAIYAEWRARHDGTDQITGSKTADMRSAIVDYFRDQGQIMIATEAGAEGINLQFCSLVVNYDLPWNPQRIEQRIGRCHRYGQKHDVVVVNFLNKSNAADQRVYELLAEKFQLFDGVFGASDEVLGSIESGIDFEKRIADIYQQCRTEQEIQDSFDALRRELEGQIDERMQQARSKLLENFDEEVHERLRFNVQASREYLTKYEHMLWKLTKHFLEPFARFDHSDNSFYLVRNPFPEEVINPGPYRMAKNVDDANTYRIGHPLATRIIQTCKTADLPARSLVFDLTGSQTRISVLESLKGRSGWLKVSCLSVTAFEAEDHVLTAGVTDEGMPLDDDQCRRLFSLNARIEDNNIEPSSSADVALVRILDARQKRIEEEVTARNGAFFEREMDKLERWAEDVKGGLEVELKDLDREIRSKRSEVRRMNLLEEKVAGQRRIKEMEQRRAELRKDLFGAQDEVDQRKDALITQVEQRLKQLVGVQPILAIRWQIL